MSSANRMSALVAIAILAGAAAPAMLRRVDDDRLSWWDLDRRLVWLIDLFERLERREQTQRY